MRRKLFQWGTWVTVLSCALFAFPSVAQSVPPFDKAPLVKLGDRVSYGSYVVIKIGDGAYQINDPGDKKTKGGGLGVDMYLVCGKTKALLIDLGNNYIDGYKQDDIPPRKNAAEEIRTLVAGLVGKLPLDIAIGHAHPDHDGMTSAFSSDKKIIIWMPEGEDLTAPTQQHHINPLIYTTFKTGEKQFDLGGRVVLTFYMRAHTQGSTLYLDRKDLLLFTSDALGSGFGQGYSAAGIKSVASDCQKFIDWIKANLSPYERYALRVYTGHTWQNVYGGYLAKDINKIKGLVDVGYLDWRFIQDECACADGILQGKWLVKGSGLRFIADTGTWGPPTDADGNIRGYMVYGIGSIILPLKTAYEAAGLQMPADQDAAMGPSAEK